jgi:hypothetical protein
LDYKKIVIIKDASFLDEGTAVVDSDEYKAVMNNLSEIVSGALSYVDNYVSHINGTKRLHEREFARRYSFSTLPYFHDILGLSATPSVAEQ